MAAFQQCLQQLLEVCLPFFYWRNPGSKLWLDLVHLSQHHCHSNTVRDVTAILSQQYCLVAQQELHTTHNDVYRLCCVQGGAKKQPRKKKDPNAPKGPSSSYMHFNNAMRSKVRQWDSHRYSGQSWMQCFRVSCTSRLALRHDVPEGKMHSNGLAS